MRLFVAVNFSRETRAKLVRLRDELRAQSKSGNFSLPDNLHLTLAFLGECDAAQAGQAKAIVEGLHVTPFEAVIREVGRFRRDGGDIWWAGLKPEQGLSDVQRDLADKLTKAGFKLDRRGFTPHITLGREVSTDRKPWLIEPFAETIRAVDLMLSERIGGKLTYTAIASGRAAQ